MRNTFRSIFITGCIPMLLACPQPATGWIEPGSNATHFVFGIAQSVRGKPLGSLVIVSIDPCSLRDQQIGKPTWRIQYTGKGGDPTPTLFVYGQPPVGFTSDIGPAPLDAGCYEVRGSGSYVFRFIVSADGRVAMADVHGKILSAK